MKFKPSITLQHATEPDLTGQESSIPILFEGSEVFHTTNVKQKIADKLNEFGYFVDDGSVRQVNPSDIGDPDVNALRYSNICAEN